MSFGDSVAVEFMTGAGAAIIDCCLFHSIDTLKVRKQDGRPLLPWGRLQSAPAIKGPTIILASLYQGFSTNLFLKVPYMATMFGFHALNKSLLDVMWGDGTAHGEGGALREFSSAFLVGIEASLLLSPLELVRIQGQNRGKGEIVAATRYTLSKIGIRGLLTTGMHACMQREAKYCVGQFALIGAVSSAIADWAAASRRLPATPPTTRSATATAHGASTQASTLAPLAEVAALLDESRDLRTLVSSICVGFLCTLVSHPDDVVKTRQQTRITGGGEASSRRCYDGGYLSSLRHIAMSEGTGALWRGAFWRCCVRVPLGLSVINIVHPRLRPFVEDLFVVST